MGDSDTLHGKENEAYRIIMRLVNASVIGRGCRLFAQSHVCRALAALQNGTAKSSVNAGLYAESFWRKLQTVRHKLNRGYLRHHDAVLRKLLHADAELQPLLRSLTPSLVRGATKGVGHAHLLNASSSANVFERSVCYCSNTTSRDAAATVGEGDSAQHSGGILPVPKRRHREDRKAQSKSFARQKEKPLESSSHKQHCSVPSMNCFTHDNSHWKTAPFWKLGRFCFCQNSNNNTFWCIRTINETHNFLYCEFSTGFISFYNMRVDYFQLHNVAYQLPGAKLDELGQELDDLRECKGWQQCNRLHLVDAPFDNHTKPIENEMNNTATNGLDDAMAGYESLDEIVESDWSDDLL